RGYWWAPDGTSLLVARVDETPDTRWDIADPANPARRPAEVAYPPAGTPNADVSLVHVGLDGRAAPIAWDRAAFPYLATVRCRDAQRRPGTEAAAARPPGYGLRRGCPRRPRRALARHRARCPGTDPRRPDRVDHRRRGFPPAAGRASRRPGRPDGEAGHPGRAA